MVNVENGIGICGYAIVEFMDDKSMAVVATNCIVKDTKTDRQTDRQTDNRNQ